MLLRKLKCVIFQWWEGPHFLKNIVEYNNRSRKEMKIQIGDSLFNSCNERIVKTNSHLVTGEKKKNVQNIIDVKNFTTLKKLLIIASWVLRFICNVKSRICGNISNLKNHLTSGEINNSKNLWFQISHEKLINSHKFESLKNLLRLKQDEIGLYRCTARVSQISSILYETRNAIILNRNRLLTELIVEDCHYCIKHNGERHKLSEVRKEYWIPRGKSYIKHILYHCIICTRLNGRPCNYPKSPNLLLSRVDNSYPFICTGIDYTGAVYCISIYNYNVLNERDSFKCYIVIYTCASSRWM